MVHQERGDAALVARDYMEAILNYDSAAGMVDNIPSARAIFLQCNINCTRICSTIENFDAVIKYGSRVLAKDANNYDVLHHRATAYVSRDMPKEALSDLNKIHALNPSEVSIPMMIQKMRKRVISKSVIDTIIMGLMVQDDSSHSQRASSSSGYSSSFSSSSSSSSSSFASSSSSSSSSRQTVLKLNENSDYSLALFGCREDFEGKVDFLMLQEALTQRFTFDG